MHSPSSVESTSGLGYWRSSARLTLSSWRGMTERGGVLANVSAGLVVALVALPLNLALALACGLPPSVGLVTGAVAGVMGALLSASRFQITGPEVALAPITLDILSKHGFQGLLVVTFLAGVIQIALGLLRVGRVVNSIPVPVVGGFMAAVGLLVFDSQLPRLLGLPEEIRAVSEAPGLAALQHVRAPVVLLGLLVIATLVLLPRLSRRLPAPLAALGIAVVSVTAFGVSVPTVQAVEGALPLPSLPSFGRFDLVALLPSALALALLASIDSLLCALSVDERTGGERTRSDQELVAQGLANLGSACFGGMPVAAAIVRSVAAVEAGATTRLAPLSQSVALGLVLLVLAPFVSFVPLVALAAILLVVGFRLINWRLAVELWRMDRFEAMVFVATAAGILVTDFVTGIVIGVVAALVGFARQQRLALRTSHGAAAAALTGTTSPHDVATSARAGEGSSATPALELIRLDGALFFGVQDRVEELLRCSRPAKVVLLDLSEITSVDFSGATAIANASKRLRQRGARVYVTRAGRRSAPILDWVLERCEGIGCVDSAQQLSSQLASELAQRANRRSQPASGQHFPSSQRSAQHAARTALRPSSALDDSVANFTGEKP